MSVEEKETNMAYETVTLQTLLREIAGRTSSNQDADAIRMAADTLDAFAADVRRDEAVRAAEDAAAVPAIQHRDLPEQVSLLWASVGDLIGRVVRLEGEMDAAQDEEAAPAVCDSASPAEGLRTEGWLTAEERETLKNAADAAESWWGSPSPSAKVIKSLLARSTPPRVKVPHLDDLEADERPVWESACHEWIAAIRAAGGEVE